VQRGGIYACFGDLFEQDLADVKVVKEDATYITAGEEDPLLEMIEYADKPAIDPRILELKRLASRHYPQLLKPAGIAMSGTGRIIGNHLSLLSIPSCLSMHLLPNKPLFQSERESQSRNDRLTNLQTSKASKPNSLPPHLPPPPHQPPPPPSSSPPTPHPS
jgi:hypothetical protein